MSACASVMSDTDALEREIVPAHFAVSDAEALGDSRDGRVVLADCATNPSGDRLESPGAMQMTTASLASSAGSGSSRINVDVPVRRGAAKKIPDGEVEVGELSRIRAVSRLANAGR